MAQIDQSSPFSYSATETLLLILDYHTLFVKFLGAERAAETTVALKSWAKAQNIRVAHALIGIDEDAPANIKGFDRTQQILGMLRNDNANWVEADGIKPESDSNEPMFTRRAGYVSALTSNSPSDIKSWLAENGYKNLILAGLSTGGCTLRTATSATDAGYVVSVIEDACFDEPATHKVLVEKLLPMRAHVFDLESFKEQWGKKA